MKHIDIERLKAFFDKSAWLLILVGAIVLAIFDIPTLITLVSWAAFALVLAGMTIMMSKAVFPSIQLSDLLKRAENGEIPAGLVILGLLVFVGLLFNGAVTWAVR